MNWYTREKRARRRMSRYAGRAWNFRNRYAEEQEDLLEEDLLEEDLLEEEPEPVEAFYRGRRRSSYRPRRVGRRRRFRAYNRPSRRVLASDIIRIRKRTTLESVFGEYIGRLATEVQRERPDLAGLELEVRKVNDLGFRMTKRSLDGASIEFYVDCSFKLAPEFINVTIQGAKGGSNFSNRLRLFLYDPLMKTARRIAGNIPQA